MIRRLPLRQKLSLAWQPPFKVSLCRKLHEILMNIKMKESMVYDKLYEFDSDNWISYLYINL